MPVAVSVPQDSNVIIEMLFDNWAFGEGKGVPRTDAN